MKLLKSLLIVFLVTLGVISTGALAQQLPPGNTNSGPALVNGVPVPGHLVMWSDAGITDAGVTPSGTPSTPLLGWTPPSSPLGYWFGAANTGIVASTFTPATTTTYFQPMYVPAPMTIEGFGVDITTLGTTTVYAGLYASANGLPTGNVLATGNAVDTSTGDIPIAVSGPSSITRYSITAAGLYWIAYQVADTAVRCGYRTGGFLAIGNAFPSPSLADYFSSYAGAYTTGTTAGTFPSSPSITGYLPTADVCAMPVEIYSIP